MIRACETCGRIQTRQPLGDRRTIYAECIRAKGCPKHNPRQLVDMFKLSTQRDNEPRVIKLSG